VKCVPCVALCVDLFERGVLFCVGSNPFAVQLNNNKYYYYYPGLVR
jgi:hypothetical protein